MPYTVKFSIPEGRKDGEPGESFEMYCPADVPGFEIKRRIDVLRYVYGQATNDRERAAALDQARAKCIRR